MILYRAADDDYIGDTASFARCREDAEAYLDNPGYGGSRLFRARVKIDMDRVLDLTTERDPLERVCEVIGTPSPGAIGAEEYVPRVSDRLASAGYEWVVVTDSYPADCETWIWIGGEEPELVEIG